MKKLLLIIIFSFASVPSSLLAQEDVSCLVEPYSQTLKEKGSVTFAYSLSGGGDATRLSLGGLPGGVTGGFGTGSNIVLNALQGAQLGSFDVSVLYDVQDGETLMQSVCSFNVRVEAADDRDATQDYIPLPSHSEQVPAVIEQGVITVEPVSAPKQANEESAEEIFVSPLFIGVSSDEVRELQAVLKDAGYFPSWVDTTGYYGEITEKAVSDFQAEHDIDPVGFVGPLTRATLNSL